MQKSVQCDGFTLTVTVLQGSTSTGSGLTSTGGYTPEPAEQNQLMEIDSKIQQLSVKDFVPSQDSSTNLSLSQVPVQSAAPPPIGIQVKSGQVVYECSSK